MKRLFDNKKELSKYIVELIESSFEDGETTADISVSRHGVSRRNYFNIKKYALGESDEGVSYESMKKILDKFEKKYEIMFQIIE